MEMNILAESLDNKFILVTTFQLQPTGSTAAIKCFLRNLNLRDEIFLYIFLE
jgi:hypothetical protein